MAPQPRPLLENSRARCGRHPLPGTLPRGLEAPSQGRKGPGPHAQGLPTPHRGPWGQTQASQRRSAHLFVVRTRYRNRNAPPTPSTTTKAGSANSWGLEAKKTTPSRVRRQRVSVCTDVCTRVHVLHVCVRRCACTCAHVRARVCIWLSGSPESRWLLAAGRDGLQTGGGTVWSRKPAPLAPHWALLCLGLLLPHGGHV